MHGLGTRLLPLACLLVCTWPASAYSQFTHLELVDLLWDGSIQPILLRQFPSATPAQLERAHSFAYGGCLIQDIGYYPFGKRFFSDLTHYVRSGDFVLSLERNSRSLDELAFAAGALTHYVGDSIGHAEAVNRSVPLLFPDLAARYGPIVVAEQSATAHVRTEFGFDVAQVARQRYAPRAYRKKIGFRVARAALYRAFHETYGIRARGILGPARAASSSYRWSVRKLLPLFLQAEVIILGDRLPKEDQTPQLTELERMLSGTEHARNWSAAYRSPGIGAHMAALFIRIIPKIGILKALATKPPTTETEDFFVESLLHATNRSRELLGGAPVLALQDLDLDTGRPAAPGESRSLERTYADLLSALAREKEPSPPEIRASVRTFFEGTSGRGHLSSKEWEGVLADLATMRARYPELSPGPRGQ